MANTYGIKVPSGGRLPNSREIAQALEDAFIDQDSSAVDVSDALLDFIYEWCDGDVEADAAQAWTDVKTTKFLETGEV